MSLSRVIATLSLLALAGCNDPTLRVGGHTLRVPSQERVVRRTPNVVGFDSDETLEIALSETTLSRFPALRRLQSIVAGEPIALEINAKEAVTFDNLPDDIAKDSFTKVRSKTNSYMIFTLSDGSDMRVIVDGSYRIFGYCSAPEINIDSENPCNINLILKDFVVTYYINIDDVHLIDEISENLSVIIDEWVVD